jgi:hypothetical protein
LQLSLELVNDRELQINIVKLVLSVISIIIDAIFMVQHFWLYNPKRQRKELQKISMDNANEQYKSLEDQPLSN